MQLVQRDLQCFQVLGVGLDHELHFAVLLDAALPVIQRLLRLQGDAGRQPLLQQLGRQGFGLGLVGFGGEHHEQLHSALLMTAIPAWRAALPAPSHGDRGFRAWPAAAA